MSTNQYDWWYLKPLKLRQSDDLVSLYTSALATQKSDTGVLAVKGLEKIARDENQSLGYRNRAQQTLVGALENGELEIQQAAMFGLERIFDKKSPKANLFGVESKSRNAQSMGLIRLAQRGLLKDEASVAGLRQAIGSA